MVQSTLDTATSAAFKRYAAFFLLIGVQVTIGIVYKLSQHGGKYEYSTASALTMAEFFKFLISATMYYKLVHSRFDSSHLPIVIDQGGFGSSNGAKAVASLKVAWISYLEELSSSLIWASGGLALLYVINNQVAFALFQLIDPGKVVHEASEFKPTILILILIHFQLNF